jgi:hypothetical protein
MLPPPARRAEWPIEQKGKASHHPPNMTKPASNQPPRRKYAGRSGKRHWLKITGLPGWKRAQLGVPAFGDADCSPPPKPRSAGRQPGANVSANP